MTSETRFQFQPGDIVWEDEPRAPEPRPEQRAGPPDEPRDDHGRWTTTEGQVGDAAAAAIRESGGFTISPQHGTAVTEGFAVAIKGHAGTMPGEQFLNDRAARTAFVRQWLKDNADALSEPGRNIGGWIDTETSVVYFDVSEVESSRSAAIQAGCERGEIAIYDLSAGEEIRLDC